MSFIVFNKPPHVGAQVTVTFCDFQKAEKFTLLKFVGDGSNFLFGSDTFDFQQNQIVVTVDGVLLPPTDWTVRPTKMDQTQSKVFFNKEKPFNVHATLGQIYSAPYELAFKDYSVPFTMITHRIAHELQKYKRSFVYADYVEKVVYYTKENTT